MRGVFLLRRLSEAVKCPGMPPLPDGMGSSLLSDDSTQIEPGTLGWGGPARGAEIGGGEKMLQRVGMKENFH